MNPSTLATRVLPQPRRPEAYWNDDYEAGYDAGHNAANQLSIDDERHHRAIAAPRTREPSTGMNSGGSIVERAPVEHRCQPGWIDDAGFLRQAWARPGDVWQCDCGDEWVARDAASNHATVGQRSVSAVEWKRRVTRWWRRGTA